MVALMVPGQTPLLPCLPIARERPSNVEAGIGPLDTLTPGLGDRTVAYLRVTSTCDRGGQTEIDTDLLVRAVRAGIDVGVPIVGVMHSTGVDAGDGIAALVGWGAVAKAFADASGVVPTVLAIDGPCVGGPALLLGLVDFVVLTDDASAYVNGTAAAARITGAVGIGVHELGGSAVLERRSGVAHLVAPDLAEALAITADLLDHLPDNSHEPPRVVASHDAPDRPSITAATTVPKDSRASYDARDVIIDVVDDGDLLEVRPRFGTSLVTGFAHVAGLAVGVVASQPSQLAGALDIDSSQKGARFVRLCDAFGLPIVTFVDTPGFRPGKDQEWRGMIRHGAQLAYAYAEATVPRVSVVLRKAYGGAFIVMDCKTMGNDCCLAWPSAAIAVMGASGAVEILHRRALAAATAGSADNVEVDTAELRAVLEADYEAAYLSPRIAAERGYVDAIIDPADTRWSVAQALAALHTKRERLPRRAHDNTPL